MSEARRNDWKQLLNAAMLGRQRDVLKGTVLDATVNVFELTCGHISAEHFAETLKRSFLLTGKDGTPLYWDASTFALAYTKLLDEGAFAGERVTDKGRLLEDGRAQCERCFGTGQEEMSDGSVRDGCEHLPVTDSERADLSLMRAARIDRIRAEARRRTARARPADAPPTPPRPKGDKLVCMNCARVIDTYYLRFEPGDRCGALLNAHTSDTDDPGPANLCEGRFEKVS